MRKQTGVVLRKWQNCPRKLFRAMGEKPSRQTNNKMDIHGELLYEKLAVQ